MSITELERNDVDGAIAVAEQMKRRGTWGPDAAQMLLMLQDNDEELAARLAKLEE